MKTTSIRDAASRRPLALVAIALAIVALGSAVLAGCGGGGSETQTNTTTTTTPPPADTAQTASSDGAQIYVARCVLCHGPQGRGDGPGAAGLNPKPRNHTDAAYMNSRTDEDLLSVIRDGKGQMPAWKSVLSEEQMRAVLAYVRTLAGT
ncbi:MAG: c-type cytochrome [Acidimicrobiia bacterium]